MTAEERNRFEKLEEQISHVRREMELRNGEMRKFMYGVKNSLDDMITILSGDSTGYSHGLLKDVKSHDDRLKKLELLKNRFAWIVTGAAIPSGYGVWEFLKKILPPMLILLLFTGCITNRKREDIAHRYMRENPAVLAHVSSLHFPVQPKIGKIVFDTLKTILRDSVSCPDSTFVKCPPCESTIVTGIRVDTVPDAARIAYLDSEILRLKMENSRLTDNLDAANKTSRTRLYWIIGLAIGLIVSMYLLFKP